MVQKLKMREVIIFLFKEDHHKGDPTNSDKAFVAK